MSTARELEVVLFGATGYTGRLVAEHFASAEGLRWAIAGRSRDRLEALRGELKADVPILVGDAHDAASLDAIAARTRVVCTTVGPYAKHGSELVGACVRAGTHYCDLTGEVPWIRRMIDAHHEEAAERGARIVHCCGFDSIPSDLGVLMLYEEMQARGLTLARVDAFYGASKGGFSAGTFASAVGIMEELKADPGLRRLLGHPYALNPRPIESGPDGSDPKGLGYERRLGRWTVPFLMAPINTRVVRRSNALMGYRYGREFRYTERMSLPGGLKGLAVASTVFGGLAALGVAIQVPALRRAIERRLPGGDENRESPERLEGYFKVRLLAEPDGSGEPRLHGEIADHRDPGYGSTAVMLGESALCLARDDLPSSGGGVLTPASAMGARLLERLRRAGMTWTVEEER